MTRCRPAARGRLAAWCLAVCLVAAGSAHAQPRAAGAVGVGDIVKISVFQNPDMATETRVSDNGTITFPLLGTVPIAGLTTGEAEARIAERLNKGGFVVNPQVNVYVLSARSRQVAVLGQVGKPGRYSMEEASTRIVDVLAQAGGSTGADTVSLVTTRNGAPVKMEIDIPDMFLKGDLAQNVELQNGDIIFVQRAQVFYIYGEAARPGAYRLERRMTVMQAIALAGGITPRGTERNVKIFRRNAADNAEQIVVDLNELVRQDDVIYIRQSLF